MAFSMHASAASDYLRSCLDKQVKNLIRFSWWPAAEVSYECDISQESSFALTAGPLAIYFEDGSILGIASDPALNSVVIWDESAKCKESQGRALERDSELFPILASDETFSTQYWKGFIGSRLVHAEILKRVSMSPKEAQLPSEVGLRLSFDNGKALIASHGLIDGSDDFTVVDDSQIANRGLDHILIG